MARLKNQRVAPNHPNTPREVVAEAEATVKEILPAEAVEKAKENVSASPPQMTTAFPQMMNIWPIF